MPDSPDQIIRKLQQENKNLKKILKQKDKKLEQKDENLKKILKQKDEELNLERQLWNSRESGWDPSTSTDLHRIEVFDGVISDESRHSATCSREEFRYILERTGACAILPPYTPQLNPVETVWRDLMDRILASVTAKNISKEIAACETKEEFKRIVPGPGGGDVTADGTHCPVQRPSEKTIRRMIYSGKKKRFTYNTNVYTNADGVVIGISRSSTS